MCCYDVVCTDCVFFKSGLLLSTSQTSWNWIQVAGIQGQLSYKITQDWSSCLIFNKNYFSFYNILPPAAQPSQWSFSPFQQRDVLLQMFPRQRIPYRDCLYHFCSSQRAGCRYIKALPDSANQFNKRMKINSFEWLFRPLESPSLTLVQFA